MSRIQLKLPISNVKWPPARIRQPSIIVQQVTLREAMNFSRLIVERPLERLKRKLMFEKTNDSGTLNVFEIISREQSSYATGRT